MAQQPPVAQRSSYDLFSDQEWDQINKKNIPFSQQCKRLFEEDPAIPIFLGATVFALGAGMRQSFIKHNPAKANHYMFMRVTCQAAAAGALVYSIYKVQNKDKERMDGLVAAQKAERAAQHQ